MGEAGQRAEGIAAMNELMASGLSPAEIANELVYHDDPGVKKLARAFAEDLANADEVEELECELGGAREELRASEKEVEGLKDLLGECLDEIKDTDLLARIKAAL
jgi:hypothetical protein